MKVYTVYYTGRKSDKFLFDWFLALVNTLPICHLFEKADDAIAVLKMWSIYRKIKFRRDKSQLVLKIASFNNANTHFQLSRILE